MRKLFFIPLSIVLVSCANNSKGGKNIGDSTKNLTKTDSHAVVKQTLTIDTVAYPGNVAYAVFKQDKKTLFYYNVDTKKGFISINKTKYNFDFYKHTINKPDYTLKSGNEVLIMVEGTKFYEYENPEPGILKGKSEKVTVVKGADTLVLKNNIDVIDGTNAD
jgi:hypothetical protein